MSEGQDRRLPRWEVQLGFPDTETLVPLFVKLPEVVSEANTAIVKAALEAFSAIKAFKGAAFGVKVEGEGANVKDLATVTVRF